MKLRQKIIQTGLDIETGEIEAMIVSVIKNLLARAEMSVKRFADPRIVVSARHRRDELGVCLVERALDRHFKCLHASPIRLQSGGGLHPKLKQWNQPFKSTACAHQSSSVDRLRRDHEHTQVLAQREILEYNGARSELRSERPALKQRHALEVRDAAEPQLLEQH